MKRLERRQVARHAFEEEIHLARQHVALAHFRPAPRPFLEMLEVGVLLAGQADKDEAGDLKAQRLAVQFGVIALDIAGLFQRPHAAQAGRRGDLGAARQLHIGDAAIGLQLGQDAQVDGVQLAGVHGRSCVGNGRPYNARRRPRAIIFLRIAHSDGQKFAPDAATGITLCTGLAFAPA